MHVQFLHAPSGATPDAAGGGQLQPSAAASITANRTQALKKHLDQLIHFALVYTSAPITVHLLKYCQRSSLCTLIQSIHFPGQVDKVVYPVIRTLSNRGQQALHTHSSIFRVQITASSATTIKFGLRETATDAFSDSSLCELIKPFIIASTLGSAAETVHDKDTHR